MVTRDKINLNLKIPFDHTGQQGYPEPYRPEFREMNNLVFYGTMRLSGSSRGRSSVKFEFTDEDGLRYEMFLKDFVELVKNKDISKGITGWWSFLKKGSNYGLTHVTDE